MLFYGMIIRAILHDNSILYDFEGDICPFVRKLQNVRQFSWRWLLLVLQHCRLISNSLSSSCRPDYQMVTKETGVVVLQA